jgi:hypothetical protein
MPFQRIRNLIFGRPRPQPRRIDLRIVVLIGIVAIVLIFFIKKGKI